MNATTITTGKVRFSYCHLTTPAKAPGSDKEKYSLSVIIPKSDKATINAINAAVAGHDHADATQTVHGFMSTADKKKLDNLGTYDDFVTAFDSIAG